MAVKVWGLAARVAAPASQFIAIDVAGCAAAAAGAAKAAIRASVIKRFIFISPCWTSFGARIAPAAIDIRPLRRIDKPGFRQ